MLGHDKFNILPTGEIEKTEKTEKTSFISDIFDKQKKLLTRYKLKNQTR